MHTGGKGSFNCCLKSEEETCARLNPIISCVSSKKESEAVNLETLAS